MIIRSNFWILFIHILSIIGLKILSNMTQPKNIYVNAMYCNVNCSDKLEMITIVLHVISGRIRNFIY